MCAYSTAAEYLPVSICGTSTAAVYDTNRASMCRQHQRRNESLKLRLTPRIVKEQENTTTPKSAYFIPLIYTPRAACAMRRESLGGSNRTNCRCDEATKTKGQKQNRQNQQPRAGHASRTNVQSIDIYGVIYLHTISPSSCAAAAQVLRATPGRMFPPTNAADDAVQHAPKVEVKSAEERERSSLHNELKANARLIRRVENALEVRRGIDLDDCYPSAHRLWRALVCLHQQ